MAIIWLDDEGLVFPPLEQATRTPNGLLAAGGDLRPERLIAAYRHGVFPWYEADQPILWWSPDPRLVLFPDRFKLSTSFRKFLRRHDYEVSFDRSFASVIRACAQPRPYGPGTWITTEMQQAYCRLHEKKLAHSVEVWEGDELVGGLYGVALGGVFFGESMFSRRSNTSKLAMAFLVWHLRAWGYQLIDCQVVSRHLLTLGAEPVSRDDFRMFLLVNLGEPGKIGPWEPLIGVQQLYEF